MMRVVVLGFFLMLLVVRPVDAAPQGKVLDVQAFTTPAGINVWLVEDASVPVISMNFSFEGGLALDPEDKPGVARLVSILLDEGAGDMRAQDFQAQLADNAISMGFTAGRDAFYGSLKTIKANAPLAFDLLRMALTDARFDNDALERMRNANVAEIKSNMGNPQWLVSRVFNGMVFANHSYGLPGAGHLESMSKITRRDLKQFVQGQFARDVLQVAVAGDITRAEVEKAVDAIFSALPANAEKVTVPVAELRDVGKTILLPLDTPQTYISAGSAGVARRDPDWQAAVIMNHILGGGGFDTRLMREIRKKRGLTYGVYTSLGSMKHATLLQANLSTSNEKAAEALAVLRDEWRRMAEEGPTAQEVADAKAYLTGSLLLGLTSTSDISGVLNSLQREGLDANYINRRNAEIDAVTIADIKRVAAKVLVPENLTVVLVGRPDDVTVDTLLDRAPGMPEPRSKR